MKILQFFRKRASANAARERLQVLLAHERASISGVDIVSVLREEILTVIGKHVQIDGRRVQIRMDRGMRVSTLGVDVEIPFDPGMRAA